VDHATVAAALVLGRSLLLFKEGDPHAGTRQVERGAGADGAGADHENVGRQPWLTRN